MKKASTWYLLALVILNVLLAFGTSAMTEKVKDALSGWGGALPGLTLFAIKYSMWPYLFVLFAGVLAAVSFFSRLPSCVFYHFISVSLIIEGGILFISQLSVVVLLPYLRA
jgi:hypothetical protein